MIPILLKLKDRNCTRRFQWAPIGLIKVPGVMVCKQETPFNKSQLCLSTSLSGFVEIYSLSPKDQGM